MAAINEDVFPHLIALTYTPIFSGKISTGMATVVFYQTVLSIPNPVKYILKIDNTSYYLVYSVLFLFIKVFVVDSVLP